MLAVRETARRILPVVVVLWASLAMIGGAVHLANEASAQDSAAKAGLGLCAVSLAFFAKKVRTRVLPPVPVGRLLPEPAPLLRDAVPRKHLLPPPAGPPLPLLLQVSRT